MFKCQHRVHWLSASVWFLQVMLWFFSRHINPTQFCCEQLNGLKQRRQIGLNKWHVSVMWLFFTFLGGCLRTVCWLEACGETTTWKWAEYKHMQAPAQMFSCSEQSLDKVGIIVGWAFRISFFSWPADCYHGRLQDHPPPHHPNQPSPLLPLWKQTHDVMMKTVELGLWITFKTDVTLIRSDFCFDRTFWGHCKISTLCLRYPKSADSDLCRVYKEPKAAVFIALLMKRIDFSVCFDLL